nr:hypothetical protein [uncultured Pedobacter sp.]
MSYTKFSLPKKSGAASPVPKDSNVIFINVKDIKKTAGVITGFPERDAGGILIIGNIELEVDAKAIGIYCTPSTIKRMDTSEGAEDAMGFNQAVEVEHPGDELEFNEFVQANINEDFIIITRECSDATGTRLHGTPCNPMKLTFESQDDNEAKKGMLKYKSSMRSKFKMAHYNGAIPALADPKPEVVGSSGAGV